LILDIKNILDKKHTIRWVFLHILIGILSSQNKYIFIIYFYLFIAINLKYIITDIKYNTYENSILIISYLFGFELLNRIIKVSPYIPSEYTKYIGIVCWLFFAIRSKKSIYGFIMLICIFPAILYDFTGQIQSLDIVNNFLAPVSLSLSIIFFGKLNPKNDLLDNSMKLIWFALVSTLFSMIIRSPSYDDMSFSLQSNESASGGTSSNQASTILGLGIFLSFYSYYKKKYFSGYTYLDLFFASIFLLQGLLTFSRGGIFVAIISIFVFLILSSYSAESKYKNLKYPGFIFNFLYISLGFLFIVSTFLIVDNITKGALSLRYKGETAGTITGTAEKNIDKITSGRSEIFLEDISVWLQYPITGVGVGGSRYARGNLIAPHIELSRLLADHGILGMIFFILLTLLGVIIYLNRKIIPNSDLLMALYVLGYLSSFHASMRTFVTPFFVGISAISLNVKK